MTFSARKIAGSIGVILLALVLTGAAQAQTDTQPQDGPAGPRAQPGNWTSEKFERQEFREEMESIRKEHEELEAARDKLLDQCVNAKDQKAAECEKQKQALHEWHDRLHERMRALREKMDAARENQPEIGMQAGESKPWPNAASAPQPLATVPLSSPPAQ